MAHIVMEIKTTLAKTGKKDNMLSKVWYLTVSFSLHSIKKIQEVISGF